MITIKFPFLDCVTMFPYSDIRVTQISNFVEIKISFFGNDQWALGWDNGHWDWDGHWDNGLGQWALGWDGMGWDWDGIGI